MNDVGAGTTDQQMNDLIASAPPAERATLTGWVALSEWRTQSGETMLVLFGKPQSSLVQLKSYLHSGLLNMVWKVYSES